MREMVSVLLDRLGFGAAFAVQVIIAPKANLAKRNFGSLQLLNFDDFALRRGGENFSFFQIGDILCGMSPLSFFPGVNISSLTIFASPQESVCASFGAGVSSACVIDVGDQKTSVCCVEDGLSHKQTRSVWKRETDRLSQ